MSLRLALVVVLSTAIILLVTCQAYPTPPPFATAATPRDTPPSFFQSPTCVDGEISAPILEGTLDIKPPPTETLTPTMTPTPVLGRVEKVARGHFATWYRYTHPKYGFAFYFPPDWKIVSEYAHFVSLAPAQESEFNLNIGFKFARETEVSIQRTGVPEGDEFVRGRVLFLGQMLPRYVLVYQGEVTAVLYNRALEVHVDDLIFTLSLDCMSLDCDVGIPPEVQALADRIVESFEWVES